MFAPALKKNGIGDLVSAKTLDCKLSVGGQFSGNRQRAGGNSSIKKELLLLLPRTGLDAERRRRGLASSIVAIRLSLTWKLASQIRRDGDPIPCNASVRLQLTQAGITLDPARLKMICMGIPLGDESFSEGHFRRHGQIARRIRQDARAETFLDVFDIAKGDDFETKIFEMLPNCDELVALLTPWSVNRNWVWTEIGAARVMGKRILGVLYGVRIETLSKDGGGMACLSYKNVLSINEFETYLAELKKRVKEAAK